MALTAYLQQTQRLLHDPNLQLYNSADLTYYINVARTQVAAEQRTCQSGVIAQIGPTSLGTNYLGTAPPYYYSSILTLPAGSQGVLNIRGMTYYTPPYSGVPLLMQHGSVLVTARSWEWFLLYNVTVPNITEGPPFEWTIRNAGYSTGYFYIYPVPDQNYYLHLDCDLVPIFLVDDTTLEIIPFPWGQAIPYFAAYLALLNSQRSSDADNMFQRYEVFAKRAREMTTGISLPDTYPMSPPTTSIGSSGSGGSSGNAPGGAPG